jgi:hypothetical protein
MSKLKYEETHFIERMEKDFEFMLKRIEDMRRFQLGDYLIGFRKRDPEYNATISEYEHMSEPILNSYGLPTKFKVVAVDKNGIPYIKELNKKGIPFGRLIVTVDFNTDEFDGAQDIYKVDPDYTDSIILGESEFDPTKTQKIKSNLHKDITKHNKSHKINTHDLKEIDTFLSTLTVNTVIWKSNTKSWTITKMMRHSVPKDVSQRHKWDSPLFEVQDSKGSIFEISVNDIRYKALYKERPRTYKELNNI